MCWHFGEEIKISREDFDSGAMDNFILHHNIYCPESVVDEGGKALSDATVLPLLGDPLFLRPIRLGSGEVIVTLKGDNDDIVKFKKRFARSN